MGFPGGSGDNESACNVGAPVSIPGLGRSPGEGNDNPLEYSRLENSTKEPDGAMGLCDRLWGRKELDTAERLTVSYFGIRILLLSFRKKLYVNIFI